jgi:LPS-assembly protein
VNFINAKYRPYIITILIIVCSCLQISQSHAQKVNSTKNLTNTLEKKSIIESNKIEKTKVDTAIKEKVLINDSLKNKNSSTIINTVDSFKISKDSLDAPVKFAASDSGVFIISTKEFFLYGKSQVQQKEMILDAGVIKYDGSNQTIVAYGAVDTTNNPLNKTKMQDGTNTTFSDTIAFNLKSQKGRTVNSFYNEGEIFVNAQVLKKVDKDVFYGWKGRFTTCNLDVPHFAFRTRKLKMINNKIAVSGAASPEFEGVPFPIGIPFGIYPLNRGRHSGILTPQFVTTEDFGIGLQGLGYYKVLNDNFDVTVKTDIYSYGGWSVNVSPKYIVRYKYSGGLNITFQNLKTLNRGFATKEEFSQSKTFDVTWNHSRDNRARPGTSFSANVHFGSTKFNQSFIGNPLINFNNRINSNINYTKNFNNKVNLNLNISHDQNAANRSVNLQLPSLGLNVITFYPFEKKERVGKAKWYESIGVGYGGSFNNTISFYDSAISIKHIIDTMQWTANHNIPITLALPPMGPVTISPSISYSEAWYDRSVYREWNNTTKKIDSSVQKGFVRRPTTSFGISMSTRIFGTYLFKKSKTIKAIRHEIRPSVGFNYTPNLDNRFNYDLQIDSNKNTVRVSRLTGGIVFNEASSGSITFGIDNLFEMKVKDKKDTAANATKKVRLIDVLGISSSYNLAADSFALQPFSIRLGTNLFEKINISAGATLDPYKVDATGRRINHLMWYDTQFKLGRITSGNVAVSTQFKSKPKDEKLANSKKLPYDPFMTPDEQQRQLDFARANPAEFTDFNIPWSLSLQYSYIFTRQIKPDYSGFTTNAYSSLGFNGDFNLTPRWKMGGTGNYDVTSGKLQQLNFFITRELHCWQLSINVTPVNIWRSFSITLNPKSGMLRDLRINRTRQFSNQ